MINAKRWKEKTQQLKLDTYALYLACKHPGVPWYAKLLVALVVGYALSPIDFIPDFIPILGYLDDLIIIPAGIALSLKMIPKEVWAECRGKARLEFSSGKQKNWVASFIIILVWLLVVFSVVLFLRAR